MTTVCTCCKLRRFELSPVLRFIFKIFNTNKQFLPFSVPRNPPFHWRKAKLVDGEDEAAELSAVGHGSVGRHLRAELLAEVQLVRVLRQPQRARVAQLCDRR